VPLATDKAAAEQLLAGCHSRHTRREAPLAGSAMGGPAMPLDIRFGGWETLRDASAEETASLPVPATGRLVIALDPPALDGSAELRGETRYVPRREHLALLWENAHGQEVLHDLDHSGCLLMGCQHDATWLPQGWTIAVFPTGWTLPHLECWFDYALKVAEDDNLNNRRDDIPPGSDASPPYLPKPRGLVTHAYLIVRNLGLPDSPAEPRGLMDRYGCLAVLRDVRHFLQRALQPGRKDGQRGGRGGRASVNARMLETIQANTKALGWNSLQWAKHLKCAKSSVVETQTWKDLAMRRDRDRAERAEKRRRRSKGSDRRRE
jgi:hypothetical protein